MKPQIILASASIGRKQLLTQLEVKFIVMASTIYEDAIIHANPIEMLQMRAKAKAEDVENKVRSWKLEVRSSLIIAADSMAILNGKPFGKPKNTNQAKKIISELMGKTHDFVSATSIMLINQNKKTEQWNNLTTTKVTFRKLTNSELNNYVTRYDFTRFAAGYALNVTPWDLVTKIDGSYTNVIGLPFEIVLPIFRKLAII